MGTPCMVMGIGVFAFPWVTGAPARHLKFWPRNQNFLPCLCAHPTQCCSCIAPAHSNTGITRDYHMVMGIHKIPIWKWGLPVSISGLQRHQSPHGNGDYQGLPYRNGGWHIPIWKWNLTITIWGSKTDQSPYWYGDYRTITGTRSYTGTVQSITHSWKEFVTIWGVG